MMNEQFKKQAEQMMKAVQDVKLPENVQAFAQDSVTKTHEAYAKISDAAKNGAKMLEAVSTEAQTGVRSIGEKMLSDLAHNTEAAFEAAHAIANSRSIPEAAKLQADFLKAQMTKVGEQTKEFFELSSKVAKQTFVSLSAVTAKTVEEVPALRAKKVSR